MLLTTHSCVCARVGVGWGRGVDKGINNPDLSSIVPCASSTLATLYTTVSIQDHALQCNFPVEIERGNALCQSPFTQRCPTIWTLHSIIAVQNKPRCCRFPSSSPFPLPSPLPPPQLLPYLRVHKKIPVQDNHCDCGLFLLTYLEYFVAARPTAINRRAVVDAGNKQQPEDGKRGGGLD